MKTAALICLSLAALPLAAQSIPDKKNPWGVKVGFFMPASSVTRTLLGSTWVSYGFGPTKFDLREGWTLSTDLEFVSQKKNGNKFFMALPTAGVQKLFADPDEKSVPYVAFRVGPAYFDYSITRAGTYISKKRFGWTSNVEVGVVISDRVKFSGRYDITSRHDGFNFDGFTFAVNYQVVRF